MKPLEVADAFVTAINSGEVGRLASLMTPDHTFVDADGSEHGGRDHMSSGWQGYFDMVPDFRIEVSDRFEHQDVVIMLGRARGTFVQDGELRPENHWSVPAAWRVVVESDKVAVWQLYANQHEMHEILKRINAT
ncbi:nuclear transport factor 2 family protein [bacterium]|nr:nuclear transport factor 2 family protein [bacterium]MBU1071919.1 nuclear transport factor 2 family protein [bacterium]MBU1674730.1 nuclear transport factor 2 family protein [bacterium]